MRVGIIGGGIAGLLAGYELSKVGAHVTIFEREQRIGGLASSFALGPQSEIERYYHFICKPDRAYLDMIRELGLASHLRWVTTKMGLFYKGAMYTIGDPLNLLMFPHFSVGDKLRFLWAAAMAKFGNNWRAIENIPAEKWLVQHYGRRAYDVLYAPLLNLKFRAHASRISAAWMWARFHRLGNSRTIAQQERLGYLEGGTQLYIAALEQALRRQGATLYTGTMVERVVVDDGRVVGVQCNGKQLSFDSVLSTVPVPQFLEFVADTNGSYFDHLHRLEYIDVLVIVLRLRHSFSPYFWMNISDPQIELAGIIEYTNLNPSPQLGGEAILYVPQYLPSSHPLYSLAEEDLFRLYCEYLHYINPAFRPNWVRDYWVHRDRFAQPICDIGFSRHILPIQTPVAGLYMTDSYQLHPDDRTISGSTNLGRRAAELILKQWKAR